MALQWNDEQKGLVLGVVQSHGWQDIMRPTLQAALNGAQQQLNMHTDQRPTPKWSDDYFKGQRAGLEFALGFWEANLAELAKPTEPEPEPEGPGSGSPYSDGHAVAPPEGTNT